MSAIDLVIPGRAKDLGGFEVSRVLPYAKRRTVGPFIFWDEMGPGTFAPGKGVDVRPHPHIGLATVTYLFKGEMTHKDNLGYEQVIRPGDVNWMTAGRGIVHSERTGDAARASGQTMHGIQSWIALPAADEDTAPSFHHHPKDTLPAMVREGFALTVIAGSAYGETSPVKTFSDMFYVAVEMNTDDTIEAPDYPERAAYVVTGEIEVSGERVKAGAMAVFAENAGAMVRACEPTRLMLLGGAPLDGPRHIFWNYVSSSEEKIEQAKADWRASAGETWTDGRFTLPPGETQYIPLPEG
ncbi:MAG: pirin family protein [Pseudomonadota bacterium]